MIRKIIFLLTGVAGLILIYGCDTDVDLNAEWQDIPVVYGILNQQDEVHYIRINRAFLGEGDALQMASHLDSITYDPDILEVRLLEMNGSSVRRVFDLDTAMIHNVDSGVFAYPEQMVYRTSGNVQLSTDYSYHLEIYNKDRQKYIESETELIHNFSIKRPLAGQLFINFTSVFPQEVIWNTARNGRLYQLTVRSFYTNYHPDGSQEKKHVDWHFSRREASGLQGGSEMSTELIGQQFYVILENSLEALSGVDRTLDSVRFIVSVANDEFNTYMKINRPSGSIIQERPEYTNISNGIGLFASRFSQHRTVRLNPASQDSLINGQHTRHLGFVKPIP